MLKIMMVNLEFSLRIFVCKLIDRQMYHRNFSKFLKIIMGLP